MQCKRHGKHWHPLWQCRIKRRKNWFRLHLKWRTTHENEFSFCILFGSKMLMSSHTHCYSFRCSPNNQMETFLNYLNPFSVFQLQTTIQHRIQISTWKFNHHSTFWTIFSFWYTTQKCLIGEEDEKGNERKNGILWQQNSESMNVEESILHLILFCLLVVHKRFI